MMLLGSGVVPDEVVVKEMEEMLPRIVNASELIVPSSFSEASEGPEFSSQ